MIIPLSDLRVAAAVCCAAVAAFAVMLAVTPSAPAAPATDGGSGTYTGGGQSYSFDLVNGGTTPWLYFALLAPAGTSFVGGATAGENTVRCVAGQPDGQPNEIECGPVSATGLAPSAHILFVATLSGPPACGAPFGLEVSATGLPPLTRVGDAIAAAGCAPAAPQASAPPTLHGTPVVGHLLTATAPTWSAKPARVGYQWQLCTRSLCRPIAGATGLELELTRREGGHAIRFVATAILGGATITSSSARVAVRPSG